ncbi:MAG: sigma-70 family RNA polymerase sigma factor [Bryobacteraceae bacterium]|nr:sigma-70 family RNA polymerase sigma factor [Bryobacteraceae bacterium]
MQSDSELLRRMELGDAVAFGELYRRRQASIYRFALHMSRSAAVAEDVVQETFLALIRNGGRYDESRGSVAAYLAGIARNLVLRATGAERTGVDAEAEAALPSDEDVLGDLTQREELEALRRAVDALPAQYREVVVLCELEEMSYADAAAALGVPVGTVRSRLNRGRQMLAERLVRRQSARCSV